LTGLRPLIAVAAMVDTLRLKNLESVSPNTQDKRGSYRFVPSERRGAMRRARHQIKNDRFDLAGFGYWYVNTAADAEQK
jgi:hypothetical protein